MSVDKGLRTEVARRAILGRGLSLGALTMLTGCDISDNKSVQAALHSVSRWNDEVQAALFSKQRLAKEYAADEVAKTFRYNAYYPANIVSPIDPTTYRLGLAGRITDKRPWTVAQLQAMTRHTQRTRHVCVEGWSYVGEWTGPRLSEFLHRVGADLTAKYVGFECADGYYEGMDMPTALHPQTFMVMSIRDKTLPDRYGFPLKIRVATKLGFKNPKWVTAIWVTNDRPRGFWPDRGYNWFSGI